jgi:hypothetical protein
MRSMAQTYDEQKEKDLRKQISLMEWDIPNIMNDKVKNNKMALLSKYKQDLNDLLKAKPVENEPETHEDEEQEGLDEKDFEIMNKKISPDDEDDRYDDI